MNLRMPLRASVRSARLAARLLLLLVLVLSPSLAAQTRSSRYGIAPRVEVGLRYAATRANSPPGTCGCFLLQGAALDAALPIAHHWNGAVEIAGNHATIVPGTTRQLSTITLLAGPRYAVTLAHRHTLFAQGIFGAARGFDAEFRRGDNAADTATGFAYSIGGAYEWRVTRTLAFRALQLDLVQTNLPNGADSRQRNLRFGFGLTFSVPLGVARR